MQLSKGKVVDICGMNFIVAGCAAGFIRLGPTSQMTEPEIRLVMPKPFVLGIAKKAVESSEATDPRVIDPSPEVEER